MNEPLTHGELPSLQLWGARPGLVPVSRFGTPRSRVSLSVELHETPVGVIKQPALDDHHVSVHSGRRVRVSCHSNRVRSIRRRGEVTLTPAGLADEWTEDDASSAVDLRLPKVLVRRVAGELGLDPDRVSIEQRCQFRDAQIEHIAWALEAESRAGCPNGSLYSDGLGTALVAHLLGRYRVSGEVAGRALSQRQLQRVTEHVEAHLDQDLSLLRLARVAGVSTSHFKSLFKQATGLPPHAYVIQRRVERAKALLSRGNLPASQVALDAGFSHQSHMARCMRRVLGVTPSAFSRSRLA